MNYRLFGIATALIALSASSGLAHDFWTQPARFTIGAGQPLDVKLFVGHDDDLDEYPRKPERIVRFEAHGPDGVTAIAGRKGRVPAGQVKLAKRGIYTIAYQSNHAYIELKAKKFEAYLREEGLSAIIAERKRRGEASRPGKESYARYTKALVRVANASTGYDRKIGLPHELTALDNPFALRKGDAIRFVLDHAGKPLPGMAVELISLSDLNRKYSGTTDKRGQVTFKVPGRGAWMVATTYMRRASKGVKGDWESFWATTSFEFAAAKRARK